jgi:MoaA/NifB/PqqE/SkfB family radical SAM enzyme
VIIATNLQYEIAKSCFLQTLPNVDMVYLSIDGIESVYETLRRGASWNRLVRSLDWISKNVKSSDRKKLHINFTACKDNISQLNEIYRLCKHFDLAGVRIWCTQAELR